MLQSTTTTWRSKLVSILLASALSLWQPMGAFGQTTGPSSHDRSGSAVDTVASTSDTAAIVRNIDSVRNECGRYDPVYRIDCLRQGLNNVAKRIPAGGDYARARSLIQRASGKLNGIVRQHADSSAPKIESEPGANRRFPAKRRYTAVKKTELKVAMQKANAVIDELRTELLRSSENSEKRLQHYQQVATAIGSTKVLLRS